jgi:hypothetical protein
MSINNIQYHRAKPFNNDIPGIFRIRLESEGSTARVEFFDDRSKEILGAISREVSCFRREQTTSVDRLFEKPMSAPFSEWFGLVLGDVYSDQNETIKGLNRSDLKYAFALRILRSYSAAPTASEALPKNARDRAIMDEMIDASFRDSVDLELLPPPLWRICFSDAQEDRGNLFPEQTASIGPLCLLRRFPSGQWCGRILGEEESRDFRPMPSFRCSYM